MNASIDKILYLLKTQGPQTAQILAQQLDMTSMGARQHLQGLEKQGLVSTYDQKESRGRPKRFWQLTEQASSRFPDTHADLTLTLINSIKTVYGEQGLESLIEHRETQQLKSYEQAITETSELAEKVAILAQLRSDEGYMAEVIPHANGYLLIENHCPICAAATQCQAFCRSELSIFKQVLGEQCKVKRTEHILQGERRCAYLIEPD